ncbi:bifunctional chorismate mutase/prephenate dehydrogenase [Enterobacteriaceae endosymbiont of Donacia cincticornis]|uniref:bifunctional chorismate mutase/prephenate dehydrogenase n=1 Tax=Enterobacteriaceae endosymbiont of Donacia cincticornis TaxID=2675773 RepID=UPI0014497F6F|nr:bifunctional chorismate mutase/prephenate dehydrogenase [Enterobacteriaceae endosymbiont of Donacia cincticornis]QJC36248.1 bifunctional chorismate mutase/prephenate dehydrogenase [Enterobacteriaceae endosymbiont of Donacia cincticornis]
MLNKINLLRDQIDILDQQLLNLLKKRLNLVKQIGLIKYKNGLPIYSLEREKNIIKLRRQEAEQKGISPNFIENILYRIINESYFYEKNKIFKNLKPNFSKILIISNNKMGLFFKKMLILTGYNINYIEEKNLDIKNIDFIFKNIGMIIINVSISFLKKIVKKLLILPKNCILVDLSPLKQLSFKMILKIYKGPVLGLYPLFNIEKKLFLKESIMYCHGHNKKLYFWFLKQIKIWGINIYDINIGKHDQYIFFIESLKYFFVLTYTTLVSKNKILLNEIFILSKPIYDLNLFILKNFSTYDIKLYIDLIFKNKENKKNIEKYFNCIKNLFFLIENYKINKIENIFKKIQDFLIKNIKN